MTSRERRLLVSLLALYAVAYVGSYAVLSARGRYVPLICGTSDGSEHWYAKGCENRTPSPSGRIKTELPSPLGFFYLPLLLIDQRWIHPSKPGCRWPKNRTDRVPGRRWTVNSGGGRKESTSCVP